MAAFTLIVLAIFFAPFYIRTRVATLPDFLEKRFDERSRIYLSFVSIISAIFIHIGFTLYAGAVVLQGLFGLNIHASIITIAVLTGLYTIIGGLLAVVLTESIQTVVLLIGAFCVTIIGLFKIGGVEGLIESVDPVSFDMLRPHGDASGMPWYTFILGYPVIGIWYWCTDQTIVQRVLGAKDENHARVGALFAGFIKILPVFILVLPGLICLGLIQKGVLPDQIDRADDAYAFMIQHILPVGLRGVVAAALLAALMSTVSGALNSVATLFSFDVYQKLKPNVPEVKLIGIGRLVTFIGMIAAILWSPFLGRFPTIFDGIATMICYIAPPITAVFLGGVFSKRISSTAAFHVLVVGSGLGFVLFLLDWFKDYIGWHLNFMIGSFILFMVCSALLIVISYRFPHVHTEQSIALVWRNPLEAIKAPGWKGIGNYKTLSLLLLFVMVMLYIIF